MGKDPVSGKNYDHRKQWLEDRLRRFAAHFGIDLICFSILSNHFHLIVRSRPDVVATWDDTEVARRWLVICPVRKGRDGQGLVRRGQGDASCAPDRFLCPLEIDESRDSVGAVPSIGPYRASDQGVLAMTTREYIQLLDWTARQVVRGKPGVTPKELPEVLQRLGLHEAAWSGLVRDFGRMFSLVAGLPQTLAGQRSRLTHRPFHQRSRFREHFPSRAA